MWLIPPSTYSHCARESVDSISASALLCRELERSAGWRGKPRLAPAWSRAWKRGGFTKLLSGWVISEPLMRDLGVAEFIASLPEIHASPIPLPENVKEPPTIDFLSTKFFGSLKSAGLLISGVKTCRGTPMDSLKPSSRHWKEWATALRRDYSARPKLTIPCGASDCSSWPFEEQGQSSQKAPALGQRLWPSAKTVRGGWERDRNGNVYPTLEGAAENWEAPSVAVTDGSRLTRGGDRSGELLLSGQAVQASKKWTTPSATDANRAGRLTERMTGTSLAQQVNTIWPGPAARDHKGINSPDHLEVSSGSLHLDQLPNFVEYRFRLPSSPDQVIAGGSMSSTDSPNSNQPSAKRNLNPIFVEALMRWPTGLSGFERQEMALTRWSLLMRSFLCQLYSAFEVEAQPDLFAGRG